MGGGNAFPLRGAKSVYSEGGVRVPAFVVGPGIRAGTELSRHNMMHLSDWIPTLLDFAGGNPNENDDWDGTSFKETFQNGENSSQETRSIITSQCNDGAAFCEEVTTRWRIN